MQATRTSFFSLVVLVVAFLGSVACGPRAQTADPDNPRVLLKTSLGEIEIELYKNKAPTTVENFLGYVNSKFYDGKVFHRVIKGFMIQTGGYDDKLVKDKNTKPPIKNESANGLSNEKYTVAMARLPQPHTASSEFYINTVDNKNLDRRNSPDGFGYCVFGKVVRGTEVVDKIEKLKCNTTKGMDDVPIQTVVIEKAILIESASKESSAKDSDVPAKK